MSDLATMSDELKGVLEAAGWSPSRCVDTTRAVRILQGRGYVVHDAARGVLQEFAGLNVEMTYAADRSGGRLRRRIRVIGGTFPVRTARRGLRGWLSGRLPPDAEFLLWKLNCHACLIATGDIADARWERDGQVYSLATRGLVWCSAEWDVMYWASSFTTLLDFLWLGGREHIVETDLDTEVNNVKLKKLGLLEF